MIVLLFLTSGAVADRTLVMASTAMATVACRGAGSGGGRPPSENGMIDAAAALSRTRRRLKKVDDDGL